MSNTKQKLLDFYELNLNSFGIIANRDDDAVGVDMDQLALNYIAYDSDEVQKLPVAVKGIPIHLPVDELCNNESDSRLLYHPLCENPLASESIILSRTKSLICFNLGAALIHVATAIATVASDPAKQKGFNKNGAKVLSAVGPCSNKVVASISKVLDSASDSKLPPLLTIHIHRKHEDYTARRVTIVKSTLLNDEMYDDDKSTINGIKIQTKKDYNAIKNIIKLVLEPFQGGYISDNDVAPSYHSMMRACAGVQMHVCALTSMFKSHCKFSKEILDLAPVSNWIEDMDDPKLMQSFRTIQPKLRGNMGDTKNSKDDGTVPSKKRNPLDDGTSRKLNDVPNNNNQHQPQQVHRPHTLQDLQHAPLGNFNQPVQQHPPMSNQSRVATMATLLQNNYQPVQQHQDRGANALSNYIANNQQSGYPNNNNGLPLRNGRFDR